MTQRAAANDRTRERILQAARKVLLAENFSGFTMDAVARAADVSRLTLYYQFESKAGLLEGLYDHIARNGPLRRLPEIFCRGNMGIEWLSEFIEVFAQFWNYERDIIRRLHALGAIDPEIEKGLKARNERRRHGVRTIVEQYVRQRPILSPLEEPVAIDMIHMLTSFETFDALAQGRRTDEVVAIIRKHANHTLHYVVPITSPRK